MRIFLLICLLAAALLGAGYFYSQREAEAISLRFPPEGQIVSVDGGRIHLTILEPEGAAVATAVLLHGASGNEREMRAALCSELLRLKYKVISIDRPGHGWSDRYDAQRDSSPAQQALLIRRALEAAGVSNAIIAGHSLAGAMTLQLALDHSEVAGAVVLIGAVSHPWPGGIALYYSISALAGVGPVFNHTLTLPLGLAMMNSALNGVFSPQKPPPDYREKSGVDLILRPQTFHYNALDVSALYNFVTAQQSRYASIRIPLAIVAGSEDTIVSTQIHARALARAVAGSSLDVIEGGGHTPHWTHRDRVIAAFESVRQRIADKARADAR